MREAKGKMRRKAEKGKGERERNTELKTEFQRRERRGKKTFLSELCKEIEKNSRMRNTRISSRKSEIPTE